MIKETKGKEFYTEGIREYLLDATLEYMHNSIENIEYDESIQVKFNVEHIKEACCWESDVRRPYFRIRGKKVTEDQAFDIIRRTDRTLNDIKYKKNDEYIILGDRIDIWDIDNRWFVEDIYPRFNGWCRPDGTIGCNEITSKYPEVYEIVMQLYNLIKAFPYLDFVMAITKWDEMPDELWETKEFYNTEQFIKEQYNDFLDNIDIAFHVHDKTIEILFDADARDRYEEYRSKYEGNPEVYADHYYENQNKSVAGIEYLDRMLEYYGLKRDEVQFSYKILGEKYGQ